MIKIKVFTSNLRRLETTNMSYPVSDYIYTIYLFNILIHSVTVIGINHETAVTMFGQSRLDGDKKAEIKVDYRTDKEKMTDTYKDFK